MIVVYGIASQLEPIKQALSDTIHACMGEVLGFPEDKRAQRFIGLDENSFFYPADRSHAYTVIEINMMAGRKPDTIKKLIKTLFTRIESSIGIAPIDIEITIQEQPDYCWGFRGMTGDEAKDLSSSVKV